MLKKETLYPEVVKCIIINGLSWKCSVSGRFVKITVGTVVALLLSITLDIQNPRATD